MDLFSSDSTQRQHSLEMDSFGVSFFLLRKLTILIRSYLIMLIQN